MTVSRREFLGASGAAAAAVALTLAPGALLAAVARHTPPPSDVSTWRAIRAQFGLAPGLAHFASFFLASHPKPVRDAIDGYRRALDDNPVLFLDRHMFESETANLQARVCEEVADYLGGKANEIALTPNTTTGLALVYHGLHLRPGDEVLTTAHDHFSHHESIRFATGRASASARRITLYDRPEDASVESMVSRVRAGLRPATRVLGITWVHSSTGVRVPVREIAAVVRDANRRRDARHQILLVVDGVHGLGALDQAVADLGCDFFCAGTHKWMFGPRGTGIVWARPDRWAMLDPMIPSFSNLTVYEAWMNGKPPAGPTLANHVTPGGFLAYEHQWAMGEAFRFHRRIGRARIAARIHALNERCREGLASIRGVTLRTPRDGAVSAGLTCFDVAGVTPETVVQRLLERRIVASAAPYRPSCVRLAPALVNDEQEVDAAVRAVRAIAAT